MKVRVLLFGFEAAAAASSSVEVEVADQATCGEVRDQLGLDYPVLRPFLRVGRFAVNREFAPPDRHLSATDEIALIGLVSGG